MFSDDRNVRSHAATPGVIDLRDIVPALPGRITTDFENQIEETTEDEAARIVADMMDGKPSAPN